MKEYKIGDKVWWAHCNTREVAHDCPVCFRKKKVVVILGDGTHIETDCDYCGKGYEGPKGYEKEWEWVAAPELVTIDGINISENNGVREVRYSYCNYSFDNEDVFDTEEEARKRCEERSAEHEKQQRQNKYARAQSSHKSFSWHVGYSRKCIKDAQRQIEWHQARITELTPKIRESKKKEKLENNLDS